MSDDNVFNPFDYEELMEPQSAQWAARRRAGQVMRRLNEALVTTDADADTVSALVQQLEAVEAVLAGQPRLLGRDTMMEAGRGSRSVIAYELGALCGQGNPVAPPLRLWMDNDTAYAEVTMGWQYEGPPGAVHGGYVAALFDDFLGMAQKITGQPGVTGTLSIRYKLPTPVDKPLKLVGKVKSVEGRKNTLVGEMWADDKLTATAEGLFIHINMADYLDPRKQ
ncbi:MAG: PaaI family thioesterase [Gammaproteobacteria bacterium]|nr:MAG: PaaI family thioesterase [Gammaproteobacteria bacterium]